MTEELLVSSTAELEGFWGRKGGFILGCVPSGLARPQAWWWER